VTQPASYGEERVDQAAEKPVGFASADDRALDHARPQTSRRRRRGWAMRRVLLAADVVGLLAAFVVTELALADFSQGLDPRIVVLFFLFVVSLPVWIVAAKVYGLYDRDEERTDHSTADDVAGVFHLVTVLVWVLFAGAWVTGVTTPQIDKTALFWALAILFVSGARVLGRSLVRRSAAYVQNAVILGAGEVGQLIARKYLQHPEYGIRLVGLVDDGVDSVREELEGLALYGTSDVVDLVRREDVERVVIAFADVPNARLLDIMRELRALDVQIDVLPRLFEVLTPKLDVHSVEGIPLIGLRPAGISRSSRLLKRAFDLLLAGTALLVTAPFFAFIAWRVKRDSPGPVLFRQPRLGEGGREFPMLKFRTMRIGTDNDVHRDYIRSIMDKGAAPVAGGLYKLDREDAVTKSGKWLRKTSLDELPNLLNVVRGEMSLVGPRPCLAYETEFFQPHHFERFLMPAGMTGLWQVTARARTTFAEALDLDVAYARGWSFGLDLKILARTPLAVFRQRGAA
jgi:exopolysaccharide biosynthesis polyprenyl glycosylphosphotransferase